MVQAGRSRDTRSSKAVYDGQQSVENLLAVAVDFMVGQCAVVVPCRAVVPTVVLFCWSS